MKAIFHSLLYFLIGTLCPLTQLQASPEPAPTPARIYPTPQRCELTDTYTQVNNITYSQLRSGESIAKGSIEEGIITLPEVEGAYAIIIKTGELQVYSYDAVGRHYAKQTLIQLLHNPLAQKSLNAQQDPYPETFNEGIARLGKLPIGCIVDWPDLPYRGVVEGYYGRPWSHEDRKQQIAFYGRNKLNTYIWAPKDDPYHHGMDCRKPYPEETAKQITELCEHAQKNHVKFIWSIHPADTIDWDKEGGAPDLKAILTKLEQMYELGVRHFACFVDDSSGNISKASRQAELCNYIYENFIQKHDELDTLLMCPTGYTKLWTPDTWLKELGEHLNPDIMPMWTGDTVISDITVSGQEWVSKALGRPTFIWWNWPCTDYKRQQLAMGRTYGLEQSDEMKTLLYGLVANPMEWPEASKIGLFGVADYTWNILAFNSAESWLAGIQRLYPKSAEALYRFCQHNSDLGRNSDGYRREESIHIQEAAQALQQSLPTLNPQHEAAIKIHQEFLNIIDSSTVLCNEPELALLRTEISSWFKLYALMGQVGKHSLQLIDPTLAQEQASKLNELLLAWVQLQDEQNRGLRPKVGTVVLQPLVEACANTAAIKYYQVISGSTPQAAEQKIQFSSSKGDASVDSQNIFDQNEDSYWSQQAHQAEGDWYQFDLGSEQQIAQINLTMGGVRPKDFPEKGQWSDSLNGTDWHNIGLPTEGDRISLSTGAEAITARYIRFTVTEAKTGNWLSLCEFSIEDESQQQASSSVKTWEQLSILGTDKQVGINRQLEVATISNKDDITLSLSTPIKPTAILIDLDNSKIWSQCQLKLTLEDGSEHIQELPKPEEGEKGIIIANDKLPAQAIKAMSLSYSGSKASIKLNNFAFMHEAATPRSDKKALTDGNLLSAWDASQLKGLPIDIPEGCRQICIISTNLHELEVDGALLTQGDDDTIRHIALKEGTRQVTLNGPTPQKDALIYEIIFLKSN